MNQPLQERKDMDREYMWDLSTLFTSDEEWEKAFGQIDGKIDACAGYAGKLNNAAAIREFLDLSSNTSREMENIFTYAMLRNTEDTRDPAGQTMSTKSFGKYVRFSSAVAFANPEILSLDEKTLNDIVNDESLKDYRFMLENLCRSKQHTLDAKGEMILAKLQEALGAPGNISEAMMDTDMKFASVKDSEGNEIELSGSNFILLESSDDRQLRRNAFENYYQSYKDLNNTFAAAYAGCVKAMTAEASIRGFSSSLEMSLFNDNIPVSVYENLISVVHSRMDLMYRYAALRKRILKLDELHYYDLYASLAEGSNARYTYEQAQQMVLDAVRPLGDEYQEIVKGAFADHWIDVYPNKGKRGGAFSSGSYDSNPYIMTNFTGTLDSVSTIAHEMGHSLHSWFTHHHQPSHYAEYTMFVAEVASTVNENLLIEQLLAKESDPKTRLALLNQYLEGFKGTVYRQTMFAEFEKKAHAMEEAGEVLNAENLNHLYEELIRLYFGEGLVMDEKVAYEWSRIPHFYRPFYVFVYATGYCSAAAISEKILKGEENAVSNYLEFLSMGGSKYPIEELAHAGVDLNTPEPLNIALDKFEKVLEDAERTADLLGL